MNDQIAKSSKVSNDPVINPAIFDWAAGIAANWKTIRDEALAIYQHIEAIPPLREISPDHRGIVKDNTWRSFFLIGYGHRLEENIARAPQTAKLVSQIPGLNSAFFSILAPGSQITPHRGVTKALITAHLGLVVPKERKKCWMRVDDQHLCWQSGKWLVFDDTYEHEVQNETDETRIVLLCQVERPLTPPGSWLAAALMGYVRRSHFVQEAKDNLSDWETAFAKSERDDHF
ncbi:aspartyl/asparaginyl beta-hydroxylase domain-containing protein [Erythrobacter sp. F6033]|uniref:aspartyl/asparaginyl beta-hydroxylase domain-containing protein n=1 Tax=Erythrobacter sp. F6033 TaxID=2926401 RepID=UPI001FF45BDC|nr:aspartyl/asparaginyl beta-hydroxylase domain-containing protein [Erythrobacter sp. F6033]